MLALWAVGALGLVLVLSQIAVVRLLRTMRAAPGPSQPLADSFSARLADLEAQVRGFKTTCSELQHLVEQRHASVTQQLNRERRPKRGEIDPELLAAFQSELLNGQQVEEPAAKHPAASNGTPRIVKQ